MLIIHKPENLWDAENDCAMSFTALEKDGEA
jgi:predicted oxidoreductase